MTSEQRRQTAHSVLALRVASLFRLSGVARQLSRDGGTGMRPPRALERQKNRQQRGLAEFFSRLLGMRGYVRARTMLISFVQSVIGSFDKYFSPLDESSSEESRNCAENHLLEKSRLHSPVSKASAVPPCESLPKSPLFRFHNPKPEE
jgi:hypothetical protein